MKVEQDTRDKKTNAWRWKMMFGVDFCRCWEWWDIGRCQVLVAGTTYLLR